MWLDAVVTLADLQRIVERLVPATIPLGNRGQLFFDAPAELTLVADRGLRIRCHAKLRWPVLGIDVEITVNSMTVVIVPSVESRDGEKVVVFAPEVEALDLALLPDVGDAELRSYINRELQSKRVELPWNYKRTLDHQFALPDWLRSGAVFDVRSNGAAVKVTNDAIGLAIGFHASVEAARTAHQTSAAPAKANIAEASGTQAADGPRVNGTTRSSLTRRRTWRRNELVRYPPRKPWARLGVAVASGLAIGFWVGRRVNP